MPPVIVHVRSAYIDGTLSVVVTSAPAGWNTAPGSTYTIARVGTSTFEVDGLPTSKPSCPRSPSCGLATTSPFSEIFTLAGGDKGATDKMHQYFSLHADFLQTWQQGALTKLENDCANNSCTNGNVQDNSQVDQLP